MRIAYVHIKSANGWPVSANSNPQASAEGSLKRLTMPPNLAPRGSGPSPSQPNVDGMHAGPRSVSENIILGLVKCNVVTQCEQWKFSKKSHELAVPGPLPVKVFPRDEHLTGAELSQYIEATGQPDVLWVNGHYFPPYLAQAFGLCSESFKIVYSKDRRPWQVAELSQYDLCLVDEAWQAEKVRQYHPSVRCFIWDKLIDYETTFYPISCAKDYDICYTAQLRPCKNHELLFRAMAAVKADRPLTCICVGGDRKVARRQLERLAADLQVAVQFAGEVPYEEVNGYINRCKIGVMCSKLDGAPRAMLEYMAANVPVLVNAELFAGTRYVGPQAGLVRAPESFHHGIVELLANRDRYAPRAYYLENFGFERVMPRFISMLEEVGCKRRIWTRGACGEKVT